MLKTAPPEQGLSSWQQFARKDPFASQPNPAMAGRALPSSSLKMITPKGTPYLGAARAGKAQRPFQPTEVAFSASQAPLDPAILAGRGVALREHI